MKLQQLAFTAACFTALLINIPSAFADAAADAAACDALAASPKDTQRPSSVPGVAYSDVKTDAAIKACSIALVSNPEDARIIYEMGRAVDIAGKEPQKMFQLYKKSSAKNYLIATYNLAGLYNNGEGVEKNLDIGAKLDCQLADAAFVLAFVNCGMDYENGWGVVKDVTKATSYYKNAAEAEDPVGFNNYGNNLIRGIGTTPDIAMGFAFLKKSIDAGDEDAPVSLAEHYDAGKEVPFDAAKAAVNYLLGLKRNGDQAKAALIESAGVKINPKTLDAIQVQLKSEGKIFEASAGKFSPAVIAVLKDYPQK